MRGCSGYLGDWKARALCGVGEYLTNILARKDPYRDPAAMYDFILARKDLLEGSKKNNYGASIQILGKQYIVCMVS